MPVSHARNGVFSKGARPWCQQRGIDWYMVFSLTTQHVGPLGRGRAAGSDGAGVHSAQFRILQTPERKPGVNRRVNIYIHESGTTRATE